MQEKLPKSGATTLTLQEVEVPTRGDLQAASKPEPARLEALVDTFGHRRKQDDRTFFRTIFEKILGSMCRPSFVQMRRCHPIEKATVSITV